MVVSTEAAGANCTNGGFKLVFYVDADGSTTMDGSESSTAQTAYACNALTTAQIAAAAAAAAQLTATTATMTGAGLSDCGPSSNESCAISPLVTGGTFYRGATTSYPATLSDYRLDKYEITVGRFRKFVEAWVGGWRPATGSGKHTHLNSGQGLANTAGGYEPGWDATWTSNVGAAATTLAGWTTSLQCEATYQTWTSAAGANEKRPQNCLTWYDIHSFCIWDGGFLPTETEWEYAATGGSEERTYPWGSTAIGANASLAVYGCYWNGTGTCSGVTNLAEVGSVAAGNGKWGQSDLVGSVWEWHIDYHNATFVSPCVDCGNFTANTYRVVRAGGFYNPSNFLSTTWRNYFQDLGVRNNSVAGRCARPTP